MILKSLVKIILLSFVLSGCASTVGYQKHLEDWNGKNIKQLVKTWGYPANSYRTPNGNLVYEYMDITIYSSRQNVTGTHIAHCTTSVISDDASRIIELKGEGNDCSTCDFLLCHINPFSLLQVLGDPQGNFPFYQRTETFQTSFQEGDGS